MPAGATLGPSAPLFPRVDIAKYKAELVAEQAAAPSAGETPPDEPAASDLIDIETFGRVELAIGVVLTAERVTGSKKLVRLEVDLGESAPRQVVAGIGTAYDPEQLLRRRIVVVANLKPAKLMGVESRGMLLAATADGTPFLLSVDAEVPPGTRVS